MAAERDKERALDGFLVASARLGDRRSMGQLAERWDRRLRAHAWRLLGDTEAAGDAVQEAWAEIVRGLPRLADDLAFPAWAYRIVSRRCAKLIGSAQRSGGSKPRSPPSRRRVKARSRTSTGCGAP